MPSRDMLIEGRNVTKIIKALSSDVRLEILELLEDKELNIQTLSKNLGLGKTTILSHVNILEEAGFLTTKYVPGTVGNQKMCQKKYDRLIYNFSPNNKDYAKSNFLEVSTSVGNFLDFEIYAPCGLANENNVIKKWDDPNIFYDIDRVKSNLLWTSFGFVEYKIPVPKLFELETVNNYEISLELSAQGLLTTNKQLQLPPYLNKLNLTDGLSDVTFWINNVEIGTITVEEYNRSGGGKYTPTWWKGSNYGKLITLKIKNSEVFINDVKQPLLSSEYLNKESFIRFKLGIKHNATNISGFTLYGNKFGNYPQDIILRVY